MMSLKGLSLTSLKLPTLSLTNASENVVETASGYTLDIKTIMENADIKSSIYQTNIGGSDTTFIVLQSSQIHTIRNSKG